MSAIPPLGQAIIRSARDYNSFLPSGQNIESRSCWNCIRKQFSFPYTCNEGWDLMRGAERGKQGARCANWTDTSKCKVDALGS